ncbi:MAG TPA: hypothetical protein PLM83_10815, partial [Bacillota bacterium]|nr:hypothetical protein [Bacillota bacterium]
MSANVNSSTLDSALRNQKNQGPAKASKWGKIIGKVLAYIVVTLGAIMMALPFVWLILSSFKTLEEISLFPP